MRKMLYPWSKYFMSPEFTLLRDKDYVAPQPTVVQQLRNYATKVGVKVHIKCTPPRLVRGRIDERIIVSILPERN